MKKVLLTMTMLLLLGTNVQVAAQKHRHTPQQELVDSTSKDAVEAFSDTTTVATPAGAVDDDWTKEDDADERIEKHLSRIVTSWDSKDALGVLLVLGVLLIIYTLFTRAGAPSGYATIVIVLCFMFAVLFLLLGIMGGYIAILFREMQDRPIYIIENISDGTGSENVEKD